MKNLIKQSIFILVIWFGVNLLALADTQPNESRGGLLYSMHCSACHNATIHWREQKLARDWQSLKGQVRLWQAFTKLRWTEEEIIDVTTYLNTHYYNFVNTEQKSVTMNQPDLKDIQ